MMNSINPQKPQISFDSHLQDIIDDLQSANLEKIDEAISKLRTLNRQKLIAELRQYLSHTSPEIRSQAVELLILLIDTSTIRDLLPVFTDAVSFVRFNLINELVQNNFLDSEFIYPLIYLLENDPDNDVRFIAAVALGRIGDERAIPPLTRAKEKDFGVDYEGETVSSAADDALKQIYLSSNG